MNKHTFPQTYNITNESILPLETNCNFPTYSLCPPYINVFEYQELYRRAYYYFLLNGINYDVPQKKCDISEDHVQYCGAYDCFMLPGGIKLDVPKKKCDISEDHVQYCGASDCFMHPDGIKLDVPKQKINISENYNSKIDFTKNKCDISIVHMQNCGAPDCWFII